MQKNTIHLFFFCLSRASVEALHEIEQNLIEKNKSVEITCFILYDYYGKVRGEAKKTAISFGWNVISINSKISNNEAIDFYLSKINTCIPDILVTDNEREKTAILISIFNDFKLPVVFVAHGYFRNEIVLYKNFFLRNLKLITTFLKSFFLLKIYQKNIYKKYAVRIHDPVGHKGEYDICCYGQKDEVVLHEYGVSENRIKLTGYPYFDQVIRAKRKKIKNKIKKILVVSTGWGDASERRKEAIEFYRFVVNFARKIGLKYRLCLRQKPGENIRIFLPKKLLSSLSKIIEFDDNKIDSYRAIQKYDLLIGDASMVMFEALILKIPVVIFQINSVKFYNNFINSIWKNKLQSVIVATEKEIVSNLDYAMSKNYLHKLLINFKKHESELFCKLDGRAGERIADLIIKKISSNSS